MKKQYNLLCCLGDSLEDFKKKGIASWFESYYNPAGLFDTVYLSCYENKNIKEYKLGRKLYAVGYKRYPFGSLFYLFKLLEMVKKRDIDIIRVYNSVGWDSALIPVIVSRLTKKPLAVSLHNDWDEIMRVDKVPFYMRVLWKISAHSTLRMASRVFLVSSSLRPYAVRYGCLSEKIVLLYNKVKVKQFKFSLVNRKNIRKELAFSNNNFVFLFVGGIVQLKNVMTLAAAFHKLHEKYNSVRLIMIGFGELDNAIDSFINANKLHNFITRVPHVPHNQISAYYHAADCFVLPSFVEGFAMMLAEAQAASRPIIVSDISGVKEVASSNNALFFNPYSVDDLVEKMVLIMNDNKLRSKLVKNALRDVQRFDWKKIEKREAGFYKELLAGAK